QTWRHCVLGCILVFVLWDFLNLGCLHNRRYLGSRQRDDSADRGTSPRSLPRKCVPRNVHQSIGVYVCANGTDLLRIYPLGPSHRRTHCCVGFWSIPRHCFVRERTLPQPAVPLRCDGLRSTLPKQGLALTKCPGEAAIGPARRNLHRLLVLLEEFGPP